MHRISLYPFGGLLFLSLWSACTFPFTTSSYKWNIKFDKEKIESKQEFLSRKLAPYSGERPPNVVFIVVDDFGKYEMSTYGSVTMNTPHIDRLASEGIRFTDCYVNAPVCAPSRAGLITGRYPTRYGFETQPMELYPNNLAAYFAGKYLMNTGDFKVVTKPKFPPEWQMVKQGVPPSEFTLPELLRMRGYTTGCVGKWHLGHSSMQTPNEMGFDEQYGFYGAFSLYTENRKSPNYVHYVQDSYSSKYQWSTGRKETSAFRRNDKIIHEERYSTFAIAEEGIEFVARHKDEPFFLYLAFNAPHVPFQAPKSYYEMYDHVADENKRVYYAMIHALDDAIGDFMDKLNLMGLEDNTIIYLISDNGGASYTKATTNAPYKGGKLTTFEGGVNVPFIMKWKGKIEAGKEYPQPVSSMDIFMTTLNIAECSIPEDREFDGVNLYPYLTGAKDGAPHDIFFWKSDHIYAMRKGDWKFIMSTRDQWAELYNIGQDKFESIDLGKEHPEILKQMLEEYELWMNKQRPALWPRIMDHKFEINGKTYWFPA